MQEHKMSKPLITSMEEGNTPPPTFEEAMQSEALKKGTAYPQQEAWSPAGTNAAAGLPGAANLLVVPVALRDVGDVVYVVNQPGRSDIEGIPAFGASFGSKAIRAVFVRKVYATLMLQLLTTVIFIAWFIFHDATRQFVQTNIIFLVVAYCTFLVTYIILVCFQSVRRTWPCNIIMLSIFTLSMSYLAATVSAVHKTYIVLMTFGIVTIVCLAITLFAIQTKWDVTGAGIYLFVFLVVVILFGCLATTMALTTGRSVMTVVYAGLLALAFAMFLVYDTQLIIGGRKVELSAEEHIYGALQLYFDIVRFYLIILSLNSHSCK